MNTTQILAAVVCIEAALGALHLWIQLREHRRDAALVPRR